MNISSLDQRIRIEAKQTTQDPEYGTPVVTWVTFATLWAQVQDTLPSKGEAQVNDLQQTTRTSRIRTRYFEGITADMRLVHISRGNAVMQILTPPAVMGRKVGLEFMAAEYSTDANAP
jgi:SPP1 family predicted phage head-tail adaptor